MRIIRAALNCCRRAMFIDSNSAHHRKIAEIMRLRVSNQSELQKLVEAGAISSRSRWEKRIEEADFEFPELILEDLHLLFLGTYKIKQAPIYVEEHLNQDGDCMIEIGDENDFILRCSIQSRHSNATKYKTWIKYSLSGESIIAWYCTRTARAMTLGSCSHVVSIVWYLSYARHHDFHISSGRCRIQQAVMENIMELEVEVLAADKIFIRRR